MVIAGVTALISEETILRLSQLSEPVKFVALIYNDSALLEALPTDEFASQMRYCLGHADDLRKEGRLLDSQMLEGVKTAKSIRVRNGRQTITDGPFTETKELLAGFNLLEADSIEEAVRIAAEFPWAATGCIEVRPVMDIALVRKQVSA